MTTVIESACVDVVELVTDYLEGALTAPAAHRVEDHLNSCADCAAYVAEMKVTIEMLGTLPPQPPSPETSRRLQALFRRWAAGG